MKKLLFFLPFLAFNAFGQNYSISGLVIDESSKEPIVAATVVLTSPKDSTFQRAVFANDKGAFRINDVPKGFYLLKSSSIGYKTNTQSAPLLSRSLDAVLVKLEQDETMLSEVEVKAKQTRAEMIGDTTQFNAEAFKVNPDASAEDLIKKMPGVTTQNGKVQAQGEDVKRVLVDGKEFFTNDVNVALKNLPAEIIAKVQVFDRLSDQSQFSGVDDGNTEKTINIITKSGKSNGEFGKIYGGYGTDERYSAGGNMNYFNDDLRVSLIGLSNNINQQNFASDDLLGVLGSSGSSRRGGRSRRGGGGVSSNSNDFLVNGQGGITSTNAIGFNLNDKWGEKVKLNLSYFFNETDNRSVDTLLQTTFLAENVNQLYNESSQGRRDNLNHRINLRMEYSLNDKNSIIFTPKISFQNAEVTDLLSATTSRLNSLLNSTISSNSDQNGGYNFGFNLLYRHRFEKRGHTFSVGVGSNNAEQNYESTLLAENEVFEGRNVFSDLNQESSRIVFNNTYNLRGEYSYPLSDRWGLRVSYRGSIRDNESGQSTFDFNPISNSYNLQNEFLSNSFINEYDTHSGSVGLRYFKGRDFMFFANVNFQNASLDGEQVFPTTLTTQRTFNNILPFAMIRYKINENKNLRVYYRSSTNAPSINQLQNVLDNDNPLQLSAGNPNLDQENSHSLTMRYNSLDPEKATTFFGYLVGSLTTNNITNISFIADQDTVIQGIDLPRGASLSLPSNYGTSKSLRSFVSYGFPATWMKSNINLNLGLNYSLNPGLVNNQENIAETTTANFGTVIGSNISENVDFTLSYNGSYNWVNNSLQQSLESDYYSQNIGLSLNLLSPKGLIFNVQGVNTALFGLEGFEQNFTLLNAKLGQKFLKNDLAELNISAFDILGQNNSISRAITANYVADTKALVLTRFFMLNFVYTIRNFR